jgi:uncharacterized membrane protein YraQ (UPF0718 family)
MNTFVETLRWFVILSGELIALFLGVSFLVGLLQAWVPEQRIRKILERRHVATSYITGTALGAITPFCSCSTIPLVAGLLSSGAPFGPTMSFLVASPLLNPVILALLMVAIGVLGTLIYAVITFLAAIGIGVLWTKMGLKSDVKRVRVRGGKSLTDSSKGSVWRRAWNQAWSFFVPMVPYLLLGTAVGALIYGYVPEDWILTVAGPDQPFAVPLAAVIGVPIYIRAETIIPIAQALLAKGMGTGAVVALIIGGAGASIPEVSLLTGLFRLRLVVAFVASIFTVAITSGITFSVFTA